LISTSVDKYMYYEQIPNVYLYHSIERCIVSLHVTFTHIQNIIQDIYIYGSEKSIYLITKTNNDL